MQIKRAKTALTIPGTEDDAKMIVVTLLGKGEKQDDARMMIEQKQMSDLSPESRPRD